MPPAKDSQRAADFLIETIDPNDAHVEWVAVRPDTLLDGAVPEYGLSADLTNSVFAPGSTNRANVAHFMCELLADPAAWATCKGKLPAINNAVGRA